MPLVRKNPYDPIECPTNVTMTAIFDADQAAREGGEVIDWAVVGEMDRARRVHTQVLMDANLLINGDDFYHAAFVFQHGDSPEDFLKAHILAMVAVIKGRVNASWIAAASLDRYLQSIDRPQVFGTQYHVGSDGKITHGAYNHRLISNAIRDEIKGF